MSDVNPARDLNTEAIIQGNQHRDLVFMTMYFQDPLENCLKGGFEHMDE